MVCDTLGSATLTSALTIASIPVFLLNCFLSLLAAPCICFGMCVGLCNQKKDAVKVYVYYDGQKRVFHVKREDTLEKLHNNVAKKFKISRPTLALYQISPLKKLEDKSSNFSDDNIYRILALKEGEGEKTAQKALMEIKPLVTGDNLNIP